MESRNFFVCLFVLFSFFSGGSVERRSIPTEHVGRGEEEVEGGKGREG